MASLPAEVKFWYAWYVRYRAELTIKVAVRFPKRGAFMAHADQSEIRCWICDKPVDLREAKANEAGKSVHEECYVLGHALRQATRKITRQSATKLTGLPIHP